MSTLDASPLLLERAKPHPDWVRMQGVYADLSHWPEKVRYYATCPQCRRVHGDYRTMKDAHDRRMCDGCNLNTLGKIKNEIQQVIHEPWKKVRPLAAIVNEDDFDKLPPAGMPDEPPKEIAVADAPAAEDDVFGGEAPEAAIFSLLTSGWVLNAIRELAIKTNSDMDSAEISELPYQGDYDPADPDSTTLFTVDLGGEEWLVFKNYDTAEAYAIERVKDDLKSDPEVYNQDWLAGYIDDDQLAAAIGDPYEDFGDEERELDYTDRLQKMVDEDRVKSDDPVFFKKNGEPRAANPARERQLETILDTWIEDSKPDFDPWESLRDIYGKDLAVKEALNLVSIDVDKAAADAVRVDGWVHFLGSYDGNEVDLACGAVATRAC